MKPSILVLLLVTVFLGCQNAAVRQPLSESTVDTKLSKARVPEEAPEVDPGDPQRDFQQDLIDAQNIV